MYKQRDRERTLTAIRYIWIPTKARHTFASITNITICWSDIQTCTMVVNTSISRGVLQCLLTGQIGKNPLHRGWYQGTDIHARFLLCIHSKHLLWSVLDAHKPLTDIDIRHLMPVIKLETGRCPICAFELKFLPCWTAFFQAKRVGNSDVTTWSKAVHLLCSNRIISCFFDKRNSYMFSINCNKIISSRLTTCFGSMPCNSTLSSTG